MIVKWVVAQASVHLPGYGVAPEDNGLNPNQLIMLQDSGQEGPGKHPNQLRLI